MTKLQQLTEIEGYEEVLDLLEAVHTDSVVPGICMNKGCDYTVGVEPDQDRGWCEECDSGTVKSCLILAGIMTRVERERLRRLQLAMLQRLAERVERCPWPRRLGMFLAGLVRLETIQRALLRERRGRPRLLAGRPLTNAERCRRYRERRARA